MGGIMVERETAIGRTAKSIGEYDRADLYDRIAHLYSISLVGFTELKAGFVNPTTQRTAGQIAALVSCYYFGTVGFGVPVELHLLEPDALEFVLT